MINVIKERPLNVRIKNFLVIKNMHVISVIYIFINIIAYCLKQKIVVRWMSKLSQTLSRSANSAEYVFVQALIIFRL